MAAMRILCSSLLLSALLTAPAAVAQMAPMSDHGVPAPGASGLASPAMSVSLHAAGGKSVNIYYNAPAKRGRVIFGTTVPYGEVWRTGANPATTIVSNTALKIGTLEVPAGTHTIYTVPAAAGKPWMLIVNNEVAQWGTEYHAEKDLGRTAMMMTMLPSAQEMMSISFEKMKAGAGQLHIRWDMTDVWVPISVM